MIAVSQTALHLVISCNNADSWIASIIYNGYHFRAQQSLWLELLGLSTLNLLLVVIGDLNTILSLGNI